VWCAGEQAVSGDLWYAVGRREFDQNRVAGMRPNLPLFLGRGTAGEGVVNVISVAPEPVVATQLRTTNDFLEPWKVPCRYRFASLIVANSVFG
jgi:hypothetical protein